MKEVVVTCNKTFFLVGVSVWLTVTCMTILATFREWLSTTMLVELDSDPGWGRASGPS